MGNFLKKALGSLAGHIPIVGGAVKELINGIDGLPPEKKAELELELQKLQVEEFKLALVDSADLRKLAMAELNVDDNLIRRTRPGILLGLFAIIFFWVVLAPILNAIPGVDIQPLDMSKVPEEIWWTFGTSYLGYGVFREYGKAKKLETLSK